MRCKGFQQRGRSPAHNLMANPFLSHQQNRQRGLAGRRGNLKFGWLHHFANCLLRTLQITTLLWRHFSSPVVMLTCMGTLSETPHEIEVQFSCGGKWSTPGTQPVRGTYSASLFQPPPSLSRAIPLLHFLRGLQSSRCDPPHPCQEGVGGRWKRITALPQNNRADSVSHSVKKTRFFTTVSCYPESCFPVSFSPEASQNPFLHYRWLLCFCQTFGFYIPPPRSSNSAECPTENIWSHHQQKQEWSYFSDFSPKGRCQKMKRTSISPRRAPLHPKRKKQEGAVSHYVTSRQKDWRPEECDELPREGRARCPSEESVLNQRQKVNCQC